jgi:hypothetical protein
MANNQEKLILENTLRLLRKGEYKLSGEEAIVFHQCFSYIVDKLKLLNKPTVVETISKPIEEPKTQKKSKKDNK